MGLDRVGIIGGGTMGAGIAEVCAKAGLDVVVSDVSPEAAGAARDRVERSIGKATERGKLSEEDATAALSRIRYTDDIEHHADRTFIIEAALEREDLKREIFQTLDDVVTDAEAVLASNTSSIPIVKLARATSRPDRVLGVHFFNPAPVMPLVEVTPSILTDSTVADKVAGFVADRLGKTVVRAQDRAGFIVNKLLIPYCLEAIRMLDAGFASKEDIDAAMEAGAGHPMGPFTLCDLIGNDVVFEVAETLYTEFSDPRYAPPPLLRRMVDAGLLGRKSGQGFYDYS